jgi:hypothetical protein
MSPLTTSPMEVWLKRLTAAALVALLAALIGLAIAFYGPGVHAQGLTATDRPSATQGDIR